jgi:hypothetical protein
MLSIVRKKDSHGKIPLAYVPASLSLLPRMEYGPGPFAYGSEDEDIGDNEDDAEDEEDEDADDDDDEEGTHKPRESNNVETAKKISSKQKEMHQKESARLKDKDEDSSESPKCKGDDNDSYVQIKKKKIKDLENIATLLLQLDFPYRFNESILVKNESYTYSWTVFLDVINELMDRNHHFLIDSFQQYIDRYHDILYELVHIRDEYDREVLSMANHSCKQILYEKLYFCGKYDLDSGPLLHKSRASLLICAKDFTLMKEYERIYETKINHLKDEYEIDMKIISKMSKDAFIEWCCDMFGESRKVCMKFCSDKV